MNLLPTILFVLVALNSCSSWVPRHGYAEVTRQPDGTWTTERAPAYEPHDVGMIAASFACAAFDLVTTEYAITHGAREMTPVLREGAAVRIPILVLKPFVVWAAGEWTGHRWLNGLHAAGACAAGGWNLNQIEGAS